MVRQYNRQRDRELASRIRRRGAVRSANPAATWEIRRRLCAGPSCKSPRQAAAESRESYVYSSGASARPRSDGGDGRRAEPAVETCVDALDSAGNEGTQEVRPACGEQRRAGICRGSWHRARRDSGPEATNRAGGTARGCVGRVPAEHWPTTTTPHPHGSSRAWPIPNRGQWVYALHLEQDALSVGVPADSSQLGRPAALGSISARQAHGEQAARCAMPLETASRVATHASLRETAGAPATRFRGAVVRRRGVPRRRVLLGLEEAGDGERRGRTSGTVQSRRGAPGVRW